MRRTAVVAWLVSLIACASHAAVLTEDVSAEGKFIKLTIAPTAGATIKEFALRSTPGNFAGEGGLVQEGFGVPSQYVPNRRLNEKLETVERVANPETAETTPTSAWRYSYDCDGPNIRGLRVTRTVELLEDEASVRVRWKVENKGGERHWMAPWVRNPIAAGGSFDAADRIDAPTLSGIQHLQRTGYAAASRNWIAVTDPVESVTVYGVFSADNTHSFLSVWELEKKLCGFQTAFVPRLIAPGESWETTYRLNIVRGLKHVDFATDELAAQLDVQPKKIELLIATVKVLKDVQIHASIVAGNGHVWKLPAKRFDTDPTRLIRCTYDWAAPGNGAYDFLAQLNHGKDKPLKLGKDTGSPHGGIDTQFVVGPAGKTRMEPWTDAALALDRGPRTLKRSLVRKGGTAIWIESPMEKIFRDDVPESDGPLDATARVRLARNERESFQVVIRPPKDNDLSEVTFKIEDLVNKETGGKIDKSNIRLAEVDYTPIQIPSYYEGPTGEWPDALTPFKSFTACGGRCTPVWFTIYAPPRTPPGVYKGAVTITSDEGKLAAMKIEATVYDFDLPVTPALKTDFGFRPGMAQDLAKAMGCVLTPEELAARYVTDALEHRVTLREPAQLPEPSKDYAADLKKYLPRLKDLLARGATTFAVPPALLDTTGQLQQANAFVVANRLQGRAFCQLADEPKPAEWADLPKRMQTWAVNAPDIPVGLTSFGLQAFLPDAADLWIVHTQILDTANNKPALERIQQGKPVWWYVNHCPPRPYANFFIDSACIEHRALFWQTWALGITGVHYWCVNYAEKGRDPYTNPVDVTPVNGDGLLIYPGANGPVDSIRWELIRDGIEDHDYLTILTNRLRKAKQAGADPALLERGAKALDLKAIVPDLTSFTRDYKILDAKRDEIARLIVELKE